VGQWVSGNGSLFDFTDPELMKVMGQVFAPENRVRDAALGAISRPGLSR
jgi:hypothetical protein